MSLPNSLNKVNRKVYTFFQETEKNRSQIQIQKNEQNLFENEVEKAEPNQMAVSRIIDLSFDWTDFQTLSSELDENTGIVTTLKIFQVWEINIVGLRFEQLPALRHNFLIRFGSGTPLLTSEIAEDTTVWSVNYIQSDNLENDLLNTYTFYYGLYISDTDGIQEVDEEGMQVRLQLSLFNPNYYR